MALSDQQQNDMYATIMNIEPYILSREIDLQQWLLHSLLTSPDFAVAVKKALAGVGVQGPPGPPGPPYNDAAVQARIAADEAKMTQVAKDLST